MILAALLLAPTVMAAAALIERRLGPSAAGWVAALPGAFVVAVLVVSVDTGVDRAAAMALSAATHVPAQVVFALVFATVLLRRGLVLGALAGATAYAAGSLLLANIAPVVAVVVAVILLGVGPRLMPQVSLRPASPRPAWSTALSCGAATLIVGAAVLVSRLAGPELAGAVAAFPTMCLTFAVLVGARDGRQAGAHALTGLVRSLPCYLAFCLVAAFALPVVGLGAIPLGLLAGVTAALATWRGVPVLRRPALAGVSLRRGEAG